MSDTPRAAQIELFTIQTSVSQGYAIFRWSASANEMGGDIVFAGKTYRKCAIKAEGFDKTGNAKLPRPTLTVANPDGALSSLLMLYGNLIGAKVTRIVTYAMFLDPVNFPEGVNTEADPNAFRVPDIFWVNRVLDESGASVSFELVAASDTQNLKIPSEIAESSRCWVRSLSDCQFAYTCPKTFPDCIENWGVTATLPFHGFPMLTQ